MAKASADWTDARLDHLAAELEPLPAQVAVLTATVEHLLHENRVLRSELAATQRQLFQVAWGLAAALIGAIAAIVATVA